MLSSSLVLNYTELSESPTYPFRYHQELGRLLRSQHVPKLVSRLIHLLKFIHELLLVLDELVDQPVGMSERVVPTL